MKTIPSKRPEEIQPYPMNPKVKAGWLCRLRSGKFRKGCGTLYDSQRKTYCCLGVLLRDPAAPTCGPDFLKFNKMPRREQSEWANLSGPTMSYFAEVNDKARVNFSFIAAVIEKYL